MIKVRNDDSGVTVIGPRPRRRLGAGERRMKRALLALSVCPRGRRQRRAAVRIKDVTSLRGARDNQLSATAWSSACRAPATRCATRRSPSRRSNRCSTAWASTCAAASLRNRNVAAVIVTADLPLGVDAGQRLDVTVSSLGDATSLMGGTLLLTQLGGRRRPGSRQRAGRGLGHRLRRRRPGGES